MKRIFSTITVIALAVFLVAGCQNAATMPDKLSDAQIKEGALKALAINVNLNGSRIDAEGNHLIFTSGLFKADLDRVTGILQLSGSITANDTVNSAALVTTTYFGTAGNPVIAEIAKATAYKRIEVKSFVADVYHAYDPSRPKLVQVYYVILDRNGIWQVAIDGKGEPILFTEFSLAGKPSDFGYPTWPEVFMSFGMPAVSPINTQVSTQIIESEGDDYVKLSGGTIRSEFWVDGIMQEFTTINSEYMTVYDEDDATLPLYSLYGYRMIATNALSNQEDFSEVVDPKNMLDSLMNWIEDITSEPDPIPTP